jgi:hypothetical protein
MTIIVLIAKKNNKAIKENDGSDNWSMSLLLKNINEK